MLFGSDEIVGLQLGISRDPISMKIAVLGATGATGKVFTTMALDAGHEVSALVRDPTKLQEKEAKVRVVVGDAKDGSAVAAVVDGADVVVSCLGHVPGGTCPMSIAFDHIVTAAARQKRPPRCVLMTTIGGRACSHRLACPASRLPCCSFTPAPRAPNAGVGGTSRMVKCVLASFVAGWGVIADYEKADALVRESGVPFVLVRPGHLLDGPGTGKYKASYSGFYHIGMKIARADVAKFILDAAGSAEHDRKAVQLCS